MFTIDDIRHIAVQIERNGEKTYRMAGKRAKGREVSRVLIWMADEEQRHAQWFESLPDSGNSPSDHPDLEEMGRSLLQEMVESQTFSLDSDELDAASDVEDVLTQSLSFENDTILFYEALKSFIEEKQVAAGLDRIIEEEKGHVRALELLRDKIQKGAETELSCFKKPST